MLIIHSLVSFLIILQQIGCVINLDLSINLKLNLVHYSLNELDKCFNRYIYIYTVHIFLYIFLNFSSELSVRVSLTACCTFKTAYGANERKKTERPGSLLHRQGCKGVNLSTT